VAVIGLGVAFLPVDARMGEVARALLAGYLSAADQLVGVTYRGTSGDLVP
jgi:hypothetical protein